jgi:hypothetical protein
MSYEHLVQTSVQTSKTHANAWRSDARGRQRHLLPPEKPSVARRPRLCGQVGYVLLALDD